MVNLALKILFPVPNESQFTKLFLSRNELINKRNNVAPFETENVSNSSGTGYFPYEWSGTT